MNQTSKEQNRGTMKLRVFLTIVIALSFQNTDAVRFVPKSDLIHNVLRIVNSLYVDHRRVVPLKMLKGSLDRLSIKIAPVLTEFEVRKPEVRINVSIDQYTRSFKFKTPENTEELNDILQQIIGFIKQYLEPGEKPQMVDYAVINGFL